MVIPVQCWVTNACSLRRVVAPSQYSEEREDLFIHYRVIFYTGHWRPFVDNRGKMIKHRCIFSLSLSLSLK
jgi:hypothetical protein